MSGKPGSTYRRRISKFLSDSSRFQKSRPSGVLRDETKLLGLYPKGQGSSEDDPLIVKVIRVESAALDWDNDDS